MKPVFAIIAALLVLFTGVGTVAAQSYEGTSLEEGIFFVPAEPGPGSIINFAVAGLAPNSELEIRFVDEDRNEVDGLTEVQGVVVVRADAAGNVNTDLRLPDNIDPGAFSIVASGESADGEPFFSELALQVSGTASDTSTPATDNSTATTSQSQAAENSITAVNAGTPETLALTGSESQGRAFGGFALVGLGLGLVFVATRRRQGAATA